MADLRTRLEKAGQGHLFAIEGDVPLDEPNLLSQLEELDANYPAGGLVRYCEEARRLLAASKSGSNSFDGSVLSVPTEASVVHVDAATVPSTAADADASLLLRQTAFVIVAGGLGERLGYQGIKLSLPVDLATGRSYLEHYCDFVRVTVGAGAPLCVMTSDDTHALTAALLERHANFGLREVTLLRQVTVGCLMDNEARLAFTDHHPTSAAGAVQRRLLRKPHGHGDVHQLLHQAGLPARWLVQGVRFVAFLQDTNATATWTVPTTLQALNHRRWSMAFTCVPRLPGEAVGCLTQVERAAGADGPSRRQVVNVEYNIIDAALKRQGGAGDVAAAGDPCGYSAYPGSINTLVVSTEPYVGVLNRTHGVCPEFINPKYTDSTRTSFKTPTRVESLMQDIAFLFPPLDNGALSTGGVVYPRWMYHPVKNAHSDGAQKAANGQEAHCPASGEEAVYDQHRRMLAAIGVDMPDLSTNPRLPLKDGMSVQLFPVVVWSAAFAHSLRSLSLRIPDPRNVRITARSCLVLEGSVMVRHLHLDGALRATCPPGALLVIDDDSCVVRNEGWCAVAISWDDKEERATTLADVDPVLTMRGYRLLRRETELIDVPAATATDPPTEAATTAVYRWRRASGIQRLSGRDAQDELSCVSSRL